jgi:hypothetical protein
MKNILLAFMLISGLLYGQTDKEFKEGVKIVKFEQKENYTKPKIVLFEFIGDTHSINHYLNLSKQLKRKFRKIGIKSKFNYNLENPSPMKADLDAIPKRSYDKKDFQFVCYIKMKDFKGWDNHLIEQRKQNYKMEFLLEKEGKTSLFAVLDIHTFYTIATQNQSIATAIAQKFK